MKKTVVVSFEGDKVNIVYAVKEKETFRVENGVTVADSAFDAFLEQEKTRNFIVVNSFTQFFCDILTVPPAPDNLITPLIENEIRKVAKMQQFAFIHAVLGERVIEQKKVKDVFVFAVEKARIRAVVERFTRCGKVIDALYPDIFAVAGFVGAGKDTVLGVLETQTNKHLFVVKEGRMQFVRLVQAFEVGMRDHDMQNISMTVNYCRQNLRLNPQRIVLVGHLCRNFFVRTNIGIPMVSFTHPVFSQQIRGRYAAVDFMLPIAALFVDPEIKIDLLPAEDKKLFQTDKWLRYAAGFFGLLAFLILAQTLVVVGSIMDLRADIKAMRKNLPHIGAVLAHYNDSINRFSRYRPLLESSRRYATLPDTYRFLRDIADMPPEAVRIDVLKASETQTPEGSPALALTVEGVVLTDDLIRMQRQFQAFAAALQSLPGFKPGDQTLDLKTGRWRLQGMHE